MNEKKHVAKDKIKDNFSKSFQSTFGYSTLNKIIEHIITLKLFPTIRKVCIKNPISLINFLITSSIILVPINTPISPINITLFQILD